MQHSSKEKKFEEKIYELLKTTYLPIIRSEEIMYNFGKHITINNIVYFDNTLVCFQTKWANSSLTISSNDFPYFIACVDEVARLSNMRTVGIYISNKSLNLDNKRLLENVNGRSGVNTAFYSIYDMTDPILIYRVQDFLHTCKMYMYSNDGDCIMRDSS